MSSEGERVIEHNGSTTPLAPLQSNILRENPNPGRPTRLTPSCCSQQEFHEPTMSPGPARCPRSPDAYVGRAIGGALPTPLPLHARRVETSPPRRSAARYHAMVFALPACAHATVDSCASTMRPELSCSAASAHAASHSMAFAVEHAMDGPPGTVSSMPLP